MNGGSGRGFRGVVRTGLAVYLYLLRAAGRLPRRQVARPARVLVTGTFVSDNWLRAHLEPLAAADACAGVWMVASRPVPPIPNVHPIYPWGWLTRVTGEVPARLMTFVATAVRFRPQVIAGFHLLFNGLAASLLARAVGARSLYFCVGGAAEVAGGGIRAENRLLNKLRIPDPVIERQLIQATKFFDVIVTMGTGAAAFFRNSAFAGAIEVIPGGIDGTRFNEAARAPETDLLLVGRLAPVKRVDLFLLAMRRLLDEMPIVTASIVGDGPLREALERRARDLHLEDHVTFRGPRSNMAAEFGRAAVFVLTSETEGLSLALLEAMTCGLPAVVSDVGDLADLVEDGVNGYLVPDQTPEAFATAIARLLRHDALRDRFSAAARRTAQRHDTRAASARWQHVLSSLTAPTGADATPMAAVATSGTHARARRDAGKPVAHELGVDLE